LKIVSLGLLGGGKEGIDGKNGKTREEIKGMGRVE
jgi:hypothetical protein